MDLMVCACCKTVSYKSIIDGRLAQLVRAPALHAGGHKFESCTAHLTSGGQVGSEAEEQDIDHDFQSGL